MATVLAGDVGGTNARFRVMEGDTNRFGQRRKVFEASYPTTEHEHFSDTVEMFLRDAGVQAVDSVCIAAAGPVEKSSNTCTLTNAGITIDGNSIDKLLGVYDRAHVVNDFEAVGYGVLTLPEHPSNGSVLHLNSTTPEHGQPAVVIGPGTGLGESVLTFDSGIGDYAVWPSEGSHCAFGAVGSRQHALSEFVEHELGECEAEHICSGPGLARVYRFICGNYNQLSAADVVSQAAAGDAHCTEALDIFLSALGQEAASLALKVLARGGVYIAGGIPPKLGEEKLLDGTLKQAFHAPWSRFASLRSSFPLRVLNTSESVGLLGAVEYAFRLAK